MFECCCISTVHNQIRLFENIAIYLLPLQYSGFRASCHTKNQRQCQIVEWHRERPISGTWNKMLCSVVQVSSQPSDEETIVLYHCSHGRSVRLLTPERLQSNFPDKFLDRRCHFSIPDWRSLERKRYILLPSYISFKFLWPYKLSCSLIT